MKNKRNYKKYIIRTLVFSLLLVTPLLLQYSNYKANAGMETYYSYEQLHKIAEDEYVKNAYIKAFCHTIDRWENNRRELTDKNYHGVQLEGKNVSFPWNGYSDSYEWCYDVSGANILPDTSSLKRYVCDKYKSMNTCNHYEDFEKELLENFNKNLFKENFESSNNI